MIASGRVLSDTATMPNKSNALRRVLLLLLGATLLSGCRATESRGGAGAPATWRGNALRLATWNLEWMLTPAAFAELRGSCVPEGVTPSGTARYIPCNVVSELERGPEDFATMAKYARQLDADVIALEEVDGARAAEQIFAGYHFCFTARTHTQNVGFAIRPGVPYRCDADVIPLALGGRVRRGAQVVLFPSSVRELHLLAVHLKSGCSRGALDVGKESCALLGQQVPLLEGWIDSQARAGHRFAVLGDFNRDLLKDGGPARNEAGVVRSLWAEIDDGDPPESDLRNAAAGEAFINCSPSQSFQGFIDQIILSRSLGEQIVPDSFGRVTYSAADAARRKLSDHCPVSVAITVAK